MQQNYMDFDDWCECDAMIVLGILCCSFVGGRAEVRIRIAEFAGGTAGLAGGYDEVRGEMCVRR
jgi:hypothetical protein